MSDSCEWSTRRLSFYKFSFTIYSMYICTIQYSMYICTNSSSAIHQLQLRPPATACLWLCIYDLLFALLAFATPRLGRSVALIANFVRLHFADGTALPRIPCCIPPLQARPMHFCLRGHSGSSFAASIQQLCEIYMCIYTIIISQQRVIQFCHDSFDAWEKPVTISHSQLKDMHI